jgi:Protein of unknown function (DUF4236)
MGTRYRNSFRVFPGIRVNMNKPWRINSLTLGKPGFLSTTVGHDGKKHLNIDLPFGYSWRKEVGRKKATPKKKEEGATARISAAEFFFILLIGVAIGAYLF